ncbi:MAG: branched-chain amino acid ABC transporter permease [Clostridia bacterium]|nr:branched-chain amino acid ABC transporter permease [Clostridia bacterium]MBO7151645.1 branched-chain amino acid ABC transporter permease [Clostridia bacterium]MBO7326452.1 branched-chain amino acid ABC transporter permease [Clostridia bacterium]
MIKTNDYLVKKMLDEQNKERSAQRALKLFHSFKLHPVVGYLIFAVILIVMQSMASAGAISTSFVSAIGSTLIYCIVGLGFCLLLGYSALASLGTAGFIGVGAYCGYYCLTEYGVGVGVAFIMSIAVAIVVGVFVGFISLRIEGIYLAIVTLGVSQIIKEVLSALVDTIRVSASSVTLFGMKFGIRDIDQVVFYLIVGILLIVMLVIHNLINSPTGRAMLAMKNSTSAAQAFGISLMKYRLLAFVLSTILAAIAGLLYMLYIRTVQNSVGMLFTLSTSLNILGAVIIGGTKSIWGTIGGTFIIFGIDKMFLQDIKFFNENPTLITIICGLLVILVVMFFPGGLVQLVRGGIFKLKVLFAKWRVRRYGIEE